MRISDWSSDVCSSDLCLGCLSPTRECSWISGFTRHCRPPYSRDWRTHRHFQRRVLLRCRGVSHIASTASFTESVSQKISEARDERAQCASAHWDEIGRASCRERVCPYG